ncbi:hypothetical protein BCD64_19405 [Nostoc sp. MBR 210]|nr:hypothetical protein BCD64_19405 [Nostoc sp. MBR 210]
MFCSIGFISPILYHHDIIVVSKFGLFKSSKGIGRGALGEMKIRSRMALRKRDVLFTFLVE